MRQSCTAAEHVCIAETALTDADQGVARSVQDKIDLPASSAGGNSGGAICWALSVAATRVSLGTGARDGLGPGKPFSVNILALAIYLHFTHAVSSYQTAEADCSCTCLPCRSAKAHWMPYSCRAKPCFDKRGRGDPGPTAPFAHHLLRRDDGAHRWPHPLELGVPEPAGGDSRHPQQPRCQRGGRCARWPSTNIWVSDLYSAHQGHADLWQICLAHQLRDCQYAIEAGDEIFAPPHEDAVAARGRAGATAHGTGRKHASFLSTPAGPRSKGD